VFVWRARVVRDELRRHTTELASAVEALDEGHHEQFAAAVRSISLERGLLERSDRLVVIPADCGWDDVGTWASLRRARELDDAGNGILGAVHCHDATANVVHAEASTVVLYGVSGLLVVSLKGLTFVTTLDRATDLRSLLDALPAPGREAPGRLATGRAPARKRGRRASRRKEGTARARPGRARPETGANERDPATQEEAWPSPPARIGAPRGRRAIRSPSSCRCSCCTS
jgi:hypothetical protein